MLVLLHLAGEPISIATIDRVIKSLPTRPGEFEEEAWQNQSYCARLVALIRARKDSLSADQWNDLEMAIQFMFYKWPAFDERPRSSLEMTFGGMADQFLFNPNYRMFCSGSCTFSPEQTMQEGRIIICDFPILQHGHKTGRLINAMIKLIFQRAWLRRDIGKCPNPAFLWQDEFQYFLLPRWDNFFQQTCRGSRIAVVCLTQNVMNLSEALGEEQLGSKTKSWLGNLGLKIFHQQNDIETCLYAADQVGKEYRYISNFNAGGGADPQQAQTSVGGSLQLCHIIEPVEFSRLSKPNADNPFAAAIVYRGGETFNATRTERDPKGKNFLPVFFSRE